MGKKPLIGMAGVLLAGVALCGCKGPNSCNHGCGGTTGVPHAHAWNTKGTVGQPGGTMHTGAPGFPAGQPGGVVTNPAHQGLPPGGMTAPGSHQVGVPPVTTNPYTTNRTMGGQPSRTIDQTGLQGGRSPIRTVTPQDPLPPVHETQPVQGMRPTGPGAGGYPSLPPHGTGLDTLPTTGPLPAAPEPAHSPGVSSQSNHPGAAPPLPPRLEDTPPMPRPDDVPPAPLPPGATGAPELGSPPK